MTPVTDLDVAIGAVTRAAIMLHDVGPAVDPADVSSVIAAVRELCWRIDSLTATIARTTSAYSGVVHDQGHDPTTAVTAITGGLTAARQHLANHDRVLGDVHNHAAHLFTPTGRAHR